MTSGDNSGASSTNGGTVLTLVWELEDAVSAACAGRVAATASVSPMASARNDFVVFFMESYLFVVFHFVSRPFNWLMTSTLSDNHNERNAFIYDAFVRGAEHTTTSQPRPNTP